jgi:oligopeptide transport system permease protein
VAFESTTELRAVPQAPGAPGAIESAGGAIVISESPLKQSWRRFRKNKAALISLVILILSGLIALAAPLVTRYDPTAFNTTNMLLDVAPSPSHWLGTDALGRDYYSRIVYGTRGPLGVAFSGAIICTLLGAATGIVAGYFGGWIDEIMSRITEIIFVIPGLLLIIMCVSLFGDLLNGPLGAAGRYVMIMLFLATDSWPVLMRLCRSEALSMKHSQYVEAAVVTGARSRHVIWRHLLPNMLGILMVQGGLLLPGFIFATAVLGIFGLGAQPPQPDIGQMVIDGATRLGVNDVEAIAPCVVLAVLTLASTFLGDGLRDAFDTRAN